MRLKDTESMRKSKECRNSLEMINLKTWASIAIKTSFNMISNKINVTCIPFVELNKITQVKFMIF